MASLNKVMIIGTLGRDPEIRSIPSGAKVANFSVATNESYTPKGGDKVDKTEWHKVLMWRGLADIAEKYLAKGSQVYLEGKLTTRSWDDADGKKHYATEIVADKMQMLGGRKAEPRRENIPATEYGKTEGRGVPSDYTPPSQDDCPF